MNINWKLNIILLFIAVLITILPLIVIRNSEFSGSDGKAEETTQEIRNDFEPWFSPFWEPPGGETENLLFAVQAAIGSGIIFYYIGYLKGKSEAVKK
ncbi:MAG: energy-coupling factor ABC transporter substrate-binding protein [Planctomycetaceae bacterium]|jgi:cobalt/nickel transport protein|nr:energy-coupling factor ABC transporter substrate-binding protein [Planctomycetaceae bacterium]